MHAYVRPPDAQRIRIARLVRRDAALAPQSPARALMIERNRRHQLPLSFILQFPTPHVMTASDDARLNSFRYPRSHDEVADLRLDAHKIARHNTDAGCVLGVNPERIGVRDLVKPFRIRAARVYLHGQAEG